MYRIKKIYHILFTELGDPRNKHWFLMSDITGILCILGLYLYGIYVLLPKFMEHKKPYNLKKIIILYNIFQIVINAALVNGFIATGWRTYDSWVCPPIDYSQKPAAVKMLSICWWTLMVKIIDLIETVFFCLRKKQNQISILHAYHHTSMVVMVWIVTKYFGGGMSTQPLLVNCFIHVLMYTYYLLSSLGPSLQKKLNKLKQAMTTLQMVQFVVIIIYLTNTIRKDCNAPIFLALVIAPYVGSIMAFFGHFYLTNYINKASKKVD